MYNSLRLPDLKFPDVIFGEKETPWNLKKFLYKGGAGARADLVEQLIADGGLGAPWFERLGLVSKLHEEINGALSSGGSRNTAHDQIRVLRKFFAFADQANLPLTLETVTETYCAWADSLVHQTRIKKDVHSGGHSPKRHTLSKHSAYNYGALVGTLLDRVLDRHTSVIELTRLEWRRHRKTVSGVQAEKQSLSNTFTFGYLLQDICDGLSLKTVLEEPLPVQITLRDGGVLSFSGGKSTYFRVEQDAGLAERYPLANLRIEAEMLMFIAQTGMNLSQAVNLELRHFTYVSHLDGYQVKDYKNRRGGVVLFDIFRDYKAHFERYLEWRRNLFSNSNKLFPFVRFIGTRDGVRISGDRLRKICKELKIAFVSPRLLRNTRVNWLLRKSADPDLTAEMAQHTKETLLAVYDRPSLQRTLVETARFWSKFDPRSSQTQAVSPGDCTGVPMGASDTPTSVPKPDCTTASGCLWCENHRDVDSFDYIWALTSFHHLKVIELSKARLFQLKEDPPPAQHVIARIRDKLMWFERSNDLRRQWVVEAAARIAEGDYHPGFQDEIAELEGGI